MFINYFAFTYFTFCFFIKVFKYQLTRQNDRKENDQKNSNQVETPSTDDEIVINSIKSVNFEGSKYIYLLFKNLITVFLCN